LGGCLLLLIWLVLPLFSIRVGIMRESVSSYSMMFGTGDMQGEGLFSLFLDLMLPILALVTVVLLSAFKVVKAQASKWLTLAVAGAGCYMAFSALIFAGRLISIMGIAGFGMSGSVGAGIILVFITWLIVTTAAVLDFLNVHITKFPGQA